jgi:hypothetical protein
MSGLSCLKTLVRSRYSRHSSLSMKSGCKAKKGLSKNSSPLGLPVYYLTQSGFAAAVAGAEPLAAAALFVGAVAPPVAPGSVVAAAGSSLGPQATATQTMASRRKNLFCTCLVPGEVIVKIPNVLGLVNDSGREWVVVRTVVRTCCKGAVLHELRVAVEPCGVRAVSRLDVNF